jgi:hypothetical protein
MTPNPMLPDSDRASPSLDKDASGRVNDMAAGEHHSDVAELARTLAAHGGGAESFDLALDLVLNEVVEQARLATGATGAAMLPTLVFGSRPGRVFQARACRPEKFNNAATQRRTHESMPRPAGA